mmetsp:Transcript_7884/g.6973  ORF Transcript_7884/g.6973 Transcript_7884/m.6973 type:complete len:136 (-) Transcript_7884:59-466(-)
MNFCSSKAICENPWVSFFYFIFIAYLPYSHFGPGQWTDAYTSFILFLYLFIAIVLLVILQLQLLIHPRFILYLFTNNYTYDKYLCKIELKNMATEQKQDCNLCLNLLEDPQLEYEDSDPSFKYRKFDKEKYYRLD